MGCVRWDAWEKACDVMLGMHGMQWMGFINVLHGMGCMGYMRWMG